METRKLATFVDLAETLNYSETADRLFTTQATVSKHILALEKEWGVILFDRSHRQVTLTEAGKLARPYAQMIVTSEAKLHQTLAAHTTDAALRLIIHAIPSISQYRAFNTIAAFARAHPEVDLRFAEAETNTLLPALAVGSADIIFTRLFDLEHPEYDVLIQETDRFAAVVPRAHPLAGVASVTIGDLAGDHWLLLNEATTLLAPVKGMLAVAGVTPTITYKGQRIDLILGMINRGMGVSVMMAGSFDPAEYANIAVVPLVPAQRSHLAFLRRRDHATPASDLFWQFCTHRD